MRLLHKKKSDFLIILLTSISVFFFRDSTLITNFELKMYDLVSSMRGTGKKSQDIVLIVADDMSLRNLGRWPWPRNYYATVLNFLYYFSPTITGFDILFTEPDAAHPENDILFGKLAGLVKNVCFGYYFDFNMSSQRAPAGNALSDEQLTNVHGDITLLPEAQSVTLPVEQLCTDVSLGFINAPRGEEPAFCGTEGASFDGVIRDLPLVIRYKSSVYPSFTLQLIRNHFKLKYSDIEVWPGKKIVLHCNRKKTIEIPVDRSGRMIINYSGGLGAFNTISFEGVLRAAEQLSQQQKPDIDPTQFKDKIVIIALTATGTDVGSLPLKEKVSPLCLVHTNAIHTILDESFIRRIHGTSILILSVVFIICSGLVATYLSPLFSALGFLFLFGSVFSGYLAALYFGFWVSVLPILTGIGLCFLGITSCNLFREEREKRRLRKMFGHYVPQNVLEELLKHPEKLRLGGENRELTVLFSDIRGFTTYCEKRTPEEVVSILNEYLDAMTEVIIEHGGTLDKYVGDAIMAIFGAPGSLLSESHAVMAVKAALAMIAKLAQLHKKWAEEEKEPFYIGIGINTGMMKVGNMGSTKLFDYTVIGDEVNVGARIESLTRVYKVDIIIGENTYQKVKKRVRCKKLGETPVKGKVNPVTIYEVVEILDESHPS